MVKITFRSDRCKGCGLCVSACPKKLLVLDRERINAQGHHTAAITDMAACVGCASCATVCPDCVIRIEKE
jgi:2-oxoglutarate ferredoxin oxidoreductase subunit delta